MLIKDMLEKFQKIEREQNNLNQQKKDLIAKIEEERILEVNALDLVKALSSCTMSHELCTITYHPICIPKSINNDMEEAKNFIKSRKMRLAIKIEAFNHYMFTLPIADIKLKNGEDLIDNLEFISDTQMFPKRNIQPLIMLNMELKHEYMQDEFFKNAILKCAKKREQENQINI